MNNSLEELYDSIENSNYYKEYKKITNISEQDSEINNLINEIKDLEKEATILEYKKDPKYKELDKLIKEKINILNNNQLYIDYLKKMEDLNSILKESSTIIEKYLEENI